MRAEQEPQYFKGRDAQDYILARRWSHDAALPPSARCPQQA